jgi:hypothetical protein
MEMSPLKAAFATVKSRKKKQAPGPPRRSARQRLESSSSDQPTSNFLTGPSYYATLDNAAGEVSGEDEDEEEVPPANANAAVIGATSDRVVPQLLTGNLLALEPWLKDARYR